MDAGVATVGKDMAPRLSRAQLVIMKPCTSVPVRYLNIHCFALGISASSRFLLQKRDFQAKARVPFTVLPAGNCNPLCLCADTDQNSPTDSPRSYDLSDGWARQRCSLLTRNVWLLGENTRPRLLEQELVHGYCTIG